MAKGSFRNKLILVPAGLIVSAVASWIIVPVLLLGGRYISFEGAEKVLAKYLPDDGANSRSHNESEKSTKDKKVKTQKEL